MSLCSLLSFFFIYVSNNSFGQRAHERPFQGPYLGVSIGSQNIFGGALIDNLDVLAQESAMVLEVLGGYRFQFLDNRLVIGVEYQYGFSDGKMTESDPRDGLEINYHNNRQFGTDLKIGYAFGSTDVSNFGR